MRTTLTLLCLLLISVPAYPGEFVAINDSYYIWRKGKLYLVTTSVLESKDNRYGKTLRRSVDSFVIEDFY